MLYDDGFVETLDTLGNPVEDERMKDPTMCEDKDELCLMMMDDGECKSGPEKDDTTPPSVKNEYQGESKLTSQIMFNDDGDDDVPVPPPVSVPPGSQHVQIDSQHVEQVTNTRTNTTEPGTPSTSV